MTTFLGVKIDHRRTWKDHIQHIKTKIAKNIGIPCKAKRIFKVPTLQTLYYSFIFPYVTYCIEVWGTAAKVYIDAILILQKNLSNN